MVEPLVISASQLGDFEDCERKWWLSRVAKLPSLPKGYLIFGTVLHACLERWCSADEQGRVQWRDCLPDGSAREDDPLRGQQPGDPVEVFPPGWETVEERGQRLSVTPNEAALIRTLVEQAVERGLVQRGDGRVCEREVRLPVIEGVELVGYIDVFIPAGATAPQIQDYKSFGESGARYLYRSDADSPNYLGRNSQLLTYAAATSIIDGWDGPVEVRHIQFPKFKDDKGPRDAIAVIPMPDWAAHWEKIQASAARMLQLRDVKRWDDIPGPKVEDACQKYGGCAFRDICGLRSTLDGYRSRVERQIAADQPARPNVSVAKATKPTKEMTNDIFARARARSQAQLAPAPAAAPQPAPAPAPAQAINGGAPPAAPIAPTLPVNPPPWANPACGSCKGTGFNKEGNPCPICDVMARKQKRPTSALYLVKGSAQEGFTATVRPDRIQDAATIGAPSSWTSREVVPAAAPAPAPVAPSSTAAVEKVQSSCPETAGSSPVRAEIPAAVQPITVVDSVPAPAAPDSDTDNPSSKRGRPKAGITILVGCAQFKGPRRDTVTAQELLHRLGGELAKEMGAESYWELDAFKRRDRIKQRSAQIAEQLGKTVLVVPGVRDPDVDSLISSLLPFAEQVYEGLR